MANAFVFTSSSKQAQKHFADTVEKGLPLERVLEFILDDDTKHKLRENCDGDTAYCWGGKSGGQDELYWNLMDYGDLIMGYRGGAIISAGDFAGKIRSPEFGREFWSDTAHRPFDLVYFFSKPEFVRRKISELPKYFAKMYQGLRRLPSSPDILRDYGSFASFVGDALQNGDGIQAGPPITSSKTVFGGLIEFLRTQPQFVKGRVYNRRKEIHELFGGQKQGGISTPKSANCIFLFTGETGEQYGYNDGWTEDGVFVFYGEGQQGDMEFVRGNLAIRDHVANGKVLHLFHALGRRGEYRYEGQFTCGSTEVREGIDADNNPRQAIAFHLLPIEAAEAEDAAPVTEEALSVLRARALEAASSAPQASVKDTVRLVRNRSAVVKQYVLARAKGICESCGLVAPFLRSDGQPYLEPHHTTRIADDGPDDPRFVGAICPNCHCEIHYGAVGAQKNRELQSRIAELENV